jgi:hypothetical protein
MSLYFKFIKAMAAVFFLSAIFASVPIYYYWTTRCQPTAIFLFQIIHQDIDDIVLFSFLSSRWTENAKAPLLAGTTGQQYQYFFTTAGSLGGVSYACGSANQGDAFTLSCPGRSVIVRWPLPYAPPNCLQLRW